MLAKQNPRMDGWPYEERQARLVSLEKENEGGNLIEE